MVKSNNELILILSIDCDSVNTRKLRMISRTSGSISLLKGIELTNPFNTIRHSYAPNNISIPYSLSEALSHSIPKDEFTTVTMLKFRLSKDAIDSAVSGELGEVLGKVKLSEGERIVDNIRGVESERFDRHIDDILLGQLENMDTDAITKPIESIAFSKILEQIGYMFERDVFTVTEFRDVINEMILILQPGDGLRVHGNSLYTYNDVDIYRIDAKIGIESMCVEELFSILCHLDQQALPFTNAKETIISAISRKRENVNNKVEQRF